MTQSTVSPEAQKDYLRALVAFDFYIGAVSFALNDTASLQGSGVNPLYFIAQAVEESAADLQRAIVGLIESHNDRNPDNIQTLQRSEAAEAYATTCILRRQEEQGLL